MKKQSMEIGGMFADQMSDKGPNLPDSPGTPISQ